MTSGRRPGSITVFDTTFQNPILLAAGTAGFGRELADVVDLDSLGGLVTKAVSPEPRQGHPGPRVAEFGAGMLNAVGLANPGLESVVKHDLPWLSEHLRRARVIVNVVGGSIEDFVTVVQELTPMDVVTAFELNVSCPNTESGGCEFAADDAVLTDLVRRVADVSTKPVLVKLAPDLLDIAGKAAMAADAGAAGFTVVNTMPGTLFADDEVHEAEMRLGLGRGGVSGPALLPVGVLATRQVVERTGLPVVGVGGVRTYEDVLQYVDAGASLVGVGTAALAHPRVPERLARRWMRHG